MSTIVLETEIKAPAERCFLLSLSVDLHKSSTAQTGEKAVAGVTAGLMKFGDTVTWEAKHLGIVQQLTSKVSAYDKPHYFVSEMIKGAFKKLHHQHIFKEENGVTLMTDIFDMQAPLGVLGTIAEKLFLDAYMKKFLVQRNEFIKRVAESEEWRKYLL